MGGGEGSLLSFASFFLHNYYIIACRFSTMFYVLATVMVVVVAGNVAMDELAVLGDVVFSQLVGVVKGFWVSLRCCVSSCFVNDADELLLSFPFHPPPPVCTLRSLSRGKWGTINLALDFP